MKLLKTKIIVILYIIIFSYNCFALEILNVSFDSNRELLSTINKSFTTDYLADTGIKIDIKQSHGGSAKQAKSVIDGLKADIVNLATSYDIDIIAENNLIAKDWHLNFPYNSAPYYSLVVFLVRKDNPKNIRDWDDLSNQNIDILTPNPKTSGGGKWNYLAAFNYAKNKFDNVADINNFVQSIYKKVKIFDIAARSATINFTKRNIGDVLITSESEAKLAIKDLKSQFLIIYPSSSIKIEYPIAITTKTKNHELAKQYGNYFYSDKSAKIIKSYYFHPSLEQENIINNTKIHNINELGGWQKMQQEHFANNAIYDNIIK
jgi:sulfate/thiosulfate transport system substrate-binding protein